MRVKLFIAFSFLFFGFQPLAIAEEKCQSPQSQMEMNTCSHKLYEEAETRLDKIYQKALGILETQNNKEKVEEFKKIHNTWLKYRELHCNYASGLYEGGTIAPLINNNCLEKLTRQRIKTIPDLFYQWEDQSGENDAN